MTTHFLITRFCTKRSLLLYIPLFISLAHVASGANATNDEVVRTDTRLTNDSSDAVSTIGNGQEVESLSLQLAALSEHNDHLQEENENLNNRLELLQETYQRENLRLSDQCSAQHIELENLQLRFEEIKTNHASLQEEKETFNDTIEELQKKVNELESYNNMLELEIQTHKILASTHAINTMALHTSETESIEEKQGSQANSEQIVQQNHTKQALEKALNTIEELQQALQQEKDINTILKQEKEDKQDTLLQSAQTIQELQYDIRDLDTKNQALQDQLSICESNQYQAAQTVAANKRGTSPSLGSGPRVRSRTDSRIAFTLSGTLPAKHTAIDSMSYVGALDDPSNRESNCHVLFYNQEGSVANSNSLEYHDNQSDDIRTEASSASHTPKSKDGIATKRNVTFFDGMQESSLSLKHQQELQKKENELQEAQKTITQLQQKEKYLQEAQKTITQLQKKEKYLQEAQSTITQLQKKEKELQEAQSTITQLQKKEKELHKAQKAITQLQQKEKELQEAQKAITQLQKKAKELQEAQKAITQLEEEKNKLASKPKNDPINKRNVEKKSSNTSYQAEHRGFFLLGSCAVLAIGVTIGLLMKKKRKSSYI